MAFVVAVDIGGTFTDLVAYDRESGDVRYAKCPTTYGDFVDGIMECLRKAGIEPRGASLVNHGTTLVINALIERRGAKAALIATKGFGDVLEIARGNRPDPFDLYYRRDEPLIPRELRYEVAERIGADGSVIEPLDEAALAALGSTLVGEGIEAVAVSFMNAYANPQHEERAVEILRRAVPDAYVTHGTDICREWYEYERTATVAANAFVGPQVSGYIAALDRRLRGEGFDGTVFMMGSNGGVLSVERARRQPIALVESGPIGGCIGTGFLRRGLGLRQRHLVRHGRHDGQMLAGRGRAVFGRSDVLCRRLCARLPDQVAGDRHRRGRLGRRLGRLARWPEPASCRPALGRIDAGPGVLWAGRHRADGDGCEPRAGTARARPVSGRRDEARHRGRAPRDPRAHRRAARL